MKIPTPKTKKVKILLITLAALLVLGVGATAYVYAFNGNLFGWTKTPLPAHQSINLDKPTKDQQSAGSETKKNAVNTPDGKPNSSGSDTPAAPTPQPNGKSTVSVTITSANQNGSTLQLRALIAANDSTGVCTLILTKGADTVTRKANTQSLPSTSTCQGFDVPTSELSSGTWMATIQYESNTLTGTGSQAITVK